MGFKTAPTPSLKSGTLKPPLSISLNDLIWGLNHFAPELNFNVCGRWMQQPEQCSTKLGPIHNHNLKGAGIHGTGQRRKSFIFERINACTNPQLLPQIYGAQIIENKYKGGGEWPWGTRNNYRGQRRCVQWMRLTVWLQDNPDCLTVLNALQYW